MAFARELQQKRLILFPIWLDETVATSPIWTSSMYKMHHVGDFTRWNHQADYQKAFAELLSDLKAPSRSEGI